MGPSSKWDHIKQLITLTSDYIKLLLLHNIFTKVYVELNLSIDSIAQL